MKFQNLLKFIYDGATPYSQLRPTGKVARVLVLSVQTFISAQNKKQSTVLTYYTLFAIVPLVALFFGIAKGFALDEKLQAFLNAKFADYEDILVWIYKFADTTLSQARGGIIAGVGVILLFFTVILLASSVEDTFNAIWHLPKRRNIFRKASDYLSILVITPLLLIVAASTTVASTPVLNNLAAGTPEAIRPLLFVLFDFLPLFISWLLFFAIYFLVPNTRVRILSAVAAALFAGTIFQLFQSSIIYVQIALAKYNAIYGSFAALPLLLIYLQWSWMIVLFGAELGFVHQNAAIGRFEGERLKLNLKSRRCYLFGIVRLVARNYGKAARPLTEELLARDLQLTLYQIRDYVNELVECGVLLKTVSPDGDAGLVPALPPEQLTIARVTDLLESAGDSQDETEPELTNIIASLRRMERDFAASSANKPLMDL